MTESSDYESVQVFIGVDVGKDTHHAVAVNRSGNRLFDKALPNDENKLRSLISDLKRMVRYCWLLTSQPPSARYPSPLPAPKASLSDISPDWQCAVSPTYTPVKPKTDARDAAIIAEPPVPYLTRYAR